MMKAGYEIRHFDTGVKPCNTILVFNYSKLNIVSNHYLNCKSCNTGPYLKDPIAIFKIKYKNTNHVQHS